MRLEKTFKEFQRRMGLLFQSNNSEEYKFLHYKRNEKARTQNKRGDVGSSAIVPLRFTTDCGEMGTGHGINRRWLISRPVASLARTILLLLACFLLVVTFSSWCLKLSGGLLEPASSKLPLVEHRHPLSTTSLSPQRRRLAGSSGENCTRMCGNMSIPYPFGLSPECARDSYFQLQCRNTSGVTGYKAQILPGDYPFLTDVVQGSFQENGTVSRNEHLLNSFQVLEIKLADATIVIDTTNIKASSCAYASNTATDPYNVYNLGNASILLPSESPYRLSALNEFVVVGCHSMGQYYYTPMNNAGTYTYEAECGPNACADQFSFDYCNAYDCCALSVQPYQNFYLLGGGQPGAKAYSQSPGFSSICGYSTLLYPPSYSSFSSAYFGNATYGAQLQWALALPDGGASPGRNCSLVKRTAGYACSPSPATCIDVNLDVRSEDSNSSNLVGYYCECLQPGYEGDGYVNGTGCKDIDECGESSLNDCNSGAICVNNIGSYGCQCPAGMQGDGFDNGTRCYKVGGGEKTGLIIGGTVGGTLLLLGACISSLVVWRLKNRLGTLQEFQQALKDRQVQPPFFSYHDLKSATSNFHESNFLGAGAFGDVYKGILRDGNPIAVKRLFNLKKEQVLNEFLNEVVLITGIKHKNLVQLKGCCINDKERILIYEYAENGNLAEALWGNGTQEKLDWVHRLNICMGIARGLSYLHEELQPRIIHRDIKPANILLDNNWNSKIADFGLAKPFMEEDSRASFTLFAGTKGYLAPEYVMDGQLTAKADVYSFGILVLEILSGRKCIDLSLPPDQVSLKKKAQDLQNAGKLLDLLEPGLDKNISETDVMKMVNIAFACVQKEPSHRPTMSQVVSMLLGNMEATTFSNYRKGKSTQNALDIYLATHHYSDESSSYASSIRYETPLIEESEDSEKKPLLRSQSLPVRVWSKIRGRPNPDSTGTGTGMTELSRMDEDSESETFY